ncbi:hypothetical protein B0H12DRAFT_1073363 [Mycena haematopus]|nr:hypothetical protein B0H12DRAFT_1073363 [Mycena haematopus]
MPESKGNVEPRPGIGVYNTARRELFEARRDARGRENIVPGALLMPLSQFEATPLYPSRPVTTRRPRLACCTLQFQYYPQHAAPARTPFVFVAFSSSYATSTPPSPVLTQPLSAMHPALVACSPRRSTLDDTSCSRDCARLATNRMIIDPRRLLVPFAPVPSPLAVPAIDGEAQRSVPKRRNAPTTQPTQRRLISLDVGESPVGPSLESGRRDAAYLRASNISPRARPSRGWSGCRRAKMGPGMGISGMAEEVEWKAVEDAARSRGGDVLRGSGLGGSNNMKTRTRVFSILISYLPIENSTMPVLHRFQCLRSAPFLGLKAAEARVAKVNNPASTLALSVILICVLATVSVQTINFLNRCESKTKASSLLDAMTCPRIERDPTAIQGLAIFLEDLSDFPKTEMPEGEKPLTQPEIM